MPPEETNPFTLSFVGIGARRSSTSWLAQCLYEHPEVCMPSIKRRAFKRKGVGLHSGNFFTGYWVHKETRFFDKDKRYAKGIARLAEYFPNCNKDQVCGEFAPSYLSGGEKIAERIYKTFPDTKIIVSLRHPVDRAVSAYLYDKYTSPKRRLKKRVFSDALEEVVRESFYTPLLQPYFERFPRERICVLFHEAPKNATLDKLWQFLDVSSFTPTIFDKPINPGQPKHIEKPRIPASLMDALRDDVESLERLIGEEIPFWEL